MAKSKIEWTSAVWNPVCGCSKISDGCLNCYAEKMHKRLQAMGLEKYKEPFNVVRLHEPSLLIPSKTKKPTVFFVNSMSDLFHEDLNPFELIVTLEHMARNPRHIFLILTKRIEYVLELTKELELNWFDNIWLGVTVESSKYLHRIETLQKIPAKHKFISFEPLIGNPFKEHYQEDNEKYFTGIDWVIVGGESGPSARPMHPAWVTLLRDYTHFSEFRRIPFFFKQWGGKIKGALLPNNIEYGKEYKQFPPEISKLMEAKKTRVSPSRKIKNLPSNLYQNEKVSV